MKFSVIMPSLLADFPGSATGKDKRLIRAIESCLDQTFTDFELIIISDGCALTKYLVTKCFAGEIESGKIKLLYVERKRLFSNAPRNAGIENAKGEYIIYLDSDDRYGENHLKLINDQLTDEDWVYANDLIWDGAAWVERSTDCTQYGRCGTSNICHKASLNLRWKDSEGGYGHDYLFIQQLLQFPNHKQVGAGEYYVCHINGGYQV